MIPPLDASHRLMAFDLVVARAWARALLKINILSITEFEEFEGRVELLGGEIENPPASARDMHPKDARALLQKRLQEVAGPLADKALRGLGERERDVTVFRLWMMDAAARARTRIDELTTALLGLARRSRDYLLFPPNFELREPVLFAHWLLAQIEVLQRDNSRLKDALDRADECPLGAGDGGGCALPVDRDAIAADLGFVRACNNTLDAVNNLEFAWELASASSAGAVHAHDLRRALAIFERSDRPMDHAPAPEPHSPQAYFFDILIYYEAALEAATSQASAIRIDRQLERFSSAAESVRTRLALQTVEGGTAPATVDGRLAALASKYRLEES
jgi:argininosuccinate lyase